MLIHHALISVSGVPSLCNMCVHSCVLQVGTCGCECASALSPGRFLGAWDREHLVLRLWSEADRDGFLPIPPVNNPHKGGMRDSREGIGRMGLLGDPVYLVSTLDSSRQLSGASVTLARIPST